MKSLRFMLAVVLISISAAAFAQDTQNTQSDAQKAFDKLKTLAGTWEGPVKMEGHDHGNGNGAPESVQVSLRVTSRGNALVHEMGDLNRTDDPTKYDHPVTMFYLDNGKLMLTHFCDAGNRPSMAAKVSPDGKT
ncbi:MAG TPA: hypothetical protein VJW20_04850, partial [Candidatus Angelobacter sp.]|nr:hypothetical protein [Candidatus Angelobacter sp.]